MEAYIEEVRRLEEHFDRLQTKHVPRAENNIADHLSKCATQKLLVEPGTFVLHVTPTMRLYLPRVGARLRGIAAW